MEYKLNNHRGRLMQAYIPIFSSIESSFNITLNQVIRKEIIENATLGSVEKGNYLLRMGDIPKYLYFIVEGLLRGYSIDREGNEITNCFIEQGKFCCSFAIVESGAAEFSLQVLEEVKYLRIELELVRKFIRENQEIQHLFNKLSMEGITYYRNRSKALMTKSAAERYMIFKEIYPNLEQRIEQRYIASYLGITPSSFSRLKRDMIKKSYNG